MSARSFLIRGLLAGLLAGLVAFVVAYLLGESSVNAAIGVEEAHAHGDAEPVLVSRTLQSTLGLLTATMVVGTTIGGLVGVLSAVALGRLGRLGVRATVLVVAGLGFGVVYLAPFVAYPPNPPAVGRDDTIGYRTALYFLFVAISLVAAVVALLVGRRTARRWGSWYAALASIVGYLVVLVVAVALMPAYNEVPADFPATVLYEFRAASLLTQFSLWATLGLVLAELAHRLTRPRVRTSRPLDRVTA